MSASLSNSWPKTQNARYFKLLAERVIELSNPKTFDSYKVQALSTTLKLRELSVTCSKVHSKNVPKATLKPIVLEVNEALQTDPVVAALLATHEIGLETIQPDFSDSTEEIQNRARLALQLVAKSYKSECEKIILSNCTGNSSKNDLLILLKLYIAHLCAIGFHRIYINQVAVNHFAKRPILRCGKQLLKGFFSLFENSKDIEFTIAYSGTNRYLKFLSSVFGTELFHDSSELLAEEALSVPSFFGEGKDKRIALIRRVPATDTHSAVVRAESIFGVARSFLFLSSSNLRDAIDNDVYVFWDNGKHHSSVSRRSVISIASSKAARPETAPKSAQSYAEFAFSSRRSDRERPGVMRALNSAALAANSTDPETQLVTLWSGFEALLPPPTKDDNSPARIVHFTRLLTPALSAGYVSSKYSIFLKDLDNRERREVIKISSAHGVGGTDGEALANLLATNTEAAKLVGQAVSQSPLLVNRVFRLFQLAQDPKRALSKLRSHEQRLSWQIHRIYRERNEIMHSGSSSPFLVPLVENSFYYFRMLAGKLQIIYDTHGIADPFSALQLISGQHSVQVQKMDALLKDQNANEVSRKTEAIKLFFRM